MGYAVYMSERWFISFFVGLTIVLIALAMPDQEDKRKALADQQRAYDARMRTTNASGPREVK